MKLTRAQRLHACSEFLNAFLCCLDPWFSRKLREMGIISSAADMLDNADLMAFLCCWAKKVPLTNAPIEFMNAAQKLLTPSKCNNWYRFVSRSLCHESQKIHQREQTMLSHTFDPSTASDQPASISTKDDVHAKRECPLICFHKIVLQQERAANPRTKINGCTKEFWRSVREKWASLAEDHPDKQQAYKNSAATEAIARQKRLQARAQKAALKAAPMQQHAIGLPQQAPVGESQLVPLQQDVVGEAQVTNSLVVRPSCMSKLTDSDSMVSLPSSSAFNLDVVDVASTQLLDGGMSQAQFDTVVASEWPISMAKFSQLQDGSSIKALTKEARANLKFVAKDVGSIPKRVQKPEICKGGVCAATCHCDFVAMVDFFQSRLERLLRRTKQQHVLLACRVENSAGNVIVDDTFHFVTSWAPAAGIYEFKAACVPCRPVHEATEMLAVQRCYCWDQPFLGTLMHLSRAEQDPLQHDGYADDKRCSAAYGPPFNQCSHLNMFAYVDDRGFAYRILNAHKDLLSGDDPSRVVVRGCVHEDVGWDYVWSEGISISADTCFVVNEEEVKIHKASQKNIGFGGFLAPEPPAKKARQAEHEHGDSYFDLVEALAELLDDAEKEHLALMGSIVQADMKHEAEVEHDVVSEGTDGSDMEVASDLEIREGELSHAESASESEEELASDPAPPVPPPVPAPVHEPLDEAKVRQERREVLWSHRVTKSKEEVCVDLGVEQGMLHQVIDRLTGKPAGRLQSCFENTTLCATCSSHKKCKMLLSIKPKLGLALPDIEKDLLAWLAAGTEMGDQKHDDLMRHIKKEYYGMKVRS